MTLLDERFMNLRKGGMIPNEEVQTLIDRFDPIVHVDRTKVPVYPDWMKEKLHPDLELTGHLSSLTHQKSNSGFTRGKPTV